MKKRLLLFGFEKFDKLKSNPSGKIVQLLEKQLSEKFQVKGIILPENGVQKILHKKLMHSNPTTSLDLAFQGTRASH